MTKVKTELDGVRALLDAGETDQARAALVDMRKAGIDEAEADEAERLARLVRAEGLRAAILDRFEPCGGNVRVDDDCKAIGIIHNCGCHRTLTEAPYFVEPIAELQELLDAHGAWMELENAEAARIYWIGGSSLSRL